MEFCESDFIGRMGMLRVRSSSDINEVLDFLIRNLPFTSRITTFDRASVPAPSRSRRLVEEILAFEKSQLNQRTVLVSHSSSISFYIPRFKFFWECLIWAQHHHQRMIAIESRYPLFELFTDSVHFKLLSTKKFRRSWNFLFEIFPILFYWSEDVKRFPRCIYPVRNLRNTEWIWGCSTIERSASLSEWFVHIWLFHREMKKKVSMNGQTSIEMIAAISSMTVPFALIFWARQTL